DALSEATRTQREDRRVVLVAHDAYPHGAQYLALNLARTLTESFGFKVDLVCLGDGPLKADYARWSTLHDLSGVDPRSETAVLLAKRLYRDGQRTALVNSTASGFFLKTLAEQGIACVALIHELPGVVSRHGLSDAARAIAVHADKLVFPANEVAAA